MRKNEIKKNKTKIEEELKKDWTEEMAKACSMKNGKREAIWKMKRGKTGKENMKKQTLYNDRAHVMKLSDELRDTIYK